MVVCIVWIFLYSLLLSMVVINNFAKHVIMYENKSMQQSFLCSKSSRSVQNSVLITASLPEHFVMCLQPVMNICFKRGHDLDLKYKFSNCLFFNLYNASPWYF